MIQSPHVDELARRMAAALEAVERAPAERARAQRYTATFVIHGGRAGGPDIFCFPGAGASVTSFLSLAAVIDPDTRIFGIEPRGLDGSLIPHSSVAAAARHAAEEIGRNSQGAYRLLGHSFGGWIAFETARHLAASGAAVEPVVLLDTEAPGAPRELQTHLDILLKFIELIELGSGRGLRLGAGELARLDHESRLRLLLGRMIEARILPANCELSALRGRLRVFASNANSVYTPGGFFPGELFLIRVRGGTSDERSTDVAAPTTTGSDNLAAWSAHAARVTLIEVPGNHITMLERPHVEAVAHHLNAIWGGQRAEPSRVRPGDGSKAGVAHEIRNTLS